MRATFFATLEIAWTASAKVVGINTGLRMSATLFLLEPTFKYLSYGSCKYVHGQVPQLGLGNPIIN